MTDWKPIADYEPYKADRLSGDAMVWDGRLTYIAARFANSWHACTGTEAQGMLIHPTHFADIPQGPR